MQRINLWSSPRNVSTALMYAFAQREDTRVVDEPLYAAYLARFPHLDHPGRDAILRSQPTDPAAVIRQLLSGDYAGEVVVFKQMTHHLQGLSDWSFATRMTNVLLIRDPRAIIASYARVIPDPGLQDVGVALQHELFTYLEQHGALHAVLDARELLLDPPGLLERLCSQLGLSFDPAMLRWPAGARPEDGVWAEHWYHRLHRSTGFEPYRERPIELTDRQEALAASCRPYYRALYRRSLKARC